MREDFEKLGLMREGCYLICYNGAQVYDIGAGRMIQSFSLPADVVEEAFIAAHHAGVHIQAYDTNDIVLAEHDSEIIRKYCRIQSLQYRIYENVPESLQTLPPKMLVIEDDPARLDDFRRTLENLFKGKADIFLSQSNYLEIVPVNINKGTAVVSLCEKLGIPIENSVSAGDAENDTTLVKAAHIGAVMCNGSDSLKKCADYITERDNNHDGVAEIIRKFILD